MRSTPVVDQGDLPRIAGVLVDEPPGRAGQAVVEQSRAAADDLGADFGADAGPVGGYADWRRREA
ncbi:hypothetical protein [Streptomyces sp. B6B3]|uniref:hypothetical protein n=1 Tax=Streptomyces sp. B6B3 TaxID=3153570 RepID=UPI00325C68CE